MCSMIFKRTCNVGSKTRCEIIRPVALHKSICVSKIVRYEEPFYLISAFYQEGRINIDREVIKCET